MDVTVGCPVHRKVWTDLDRMRFLAECAMMSRVILYTKPRVRFEMRHVALIGLEELDKASRKDARRLGEVFQGRRDGNSQV